MNWFLFTCAIDVRKSGLRFFRWRAWTCIL